MPVIKVRENEPFDVALRRFKRSCEAGVLAEVRRREFYEKPTTERKRASFCSETSREETGSRKRTPHSSY